MTLLHDDFGTPSAGTQLWQCPQDSRAKSEKPAPWEAQAALAVCPFRQAFPRQVYGPTKN